MKVRILDCGYLLCIVIGQKAETARVVTIRFPFPLTLKSWKYLYG